MDRERLKDLVSLIQELIEALRSGLSDQENMRFIFAGLRGVVSQLLSQNELREEIRGLISVRETGRFLSSAIELRNTNSISLPGAGSVIANLSLILSTLKSKEKPKMLDSNRLNTLVSSLVGTNHRTIGGTCAHLFNYLTEYAKDNEAYQALEKARSKWSNFPGDLGIGGADWQMPRNADDAKSLAYDLYKSISEQADSGETLLLAMYGRTNLDSNISAFNSDFHEYLVDAVRDISSAAQAGARNTDSGTIVGKKVFIIHGHDDLLKKEVQLLIERADLDGIVLHEQPDKGRTIIEKLIDEGDGSVYAIALFSPDDVMMDGTKQARPNVILEVGYFLGKLGRPRVRILKKDSATIPSDLQGVLYQSVDSHGAWKLSLLKEMKNAGVEIDMDKATKRL